MKRFIRLTESELKRIIKNVIKEDDVDINEYGRKGQWKSEWNEGDQMLAMYNSLYGIDDLGMGGKLYIAHKIIGSSVASFNQQTSNFDYLDGRGGLNRPNEMQTQVYEKYKNTPKNEFKKLCLEIIHKRIANPEEAAIKKDLGNEIGSKRDEIAKSRETALRAKGITNPERWSVIKSEPLNTPGDDEVITEPEQISEKDQIKKFIRDIMGRLNTVEDKNDIMKLSKDLEFLIEYLDEIMPETDSANNMVAEMCYIFKKML
ncbi:MAG TPA: hypothetical protein PK698_01800 [Bacilli bacterium]|nr:hypothetical protein [Bacilli bacterium]